MVDEMKSDTELIEAYWAAAEDEMSPSKDIVDELIRRDLAYIRPCTPEEIAESEDIFGDFHPTTVLELKEQTQ